MPTLPDHLFLNPVLTALQTTHAHLAVSQGDAIRYQPDVTPFAALTTRTTSALRDLHSLLAPGELVWVSGLEGLDLASADLALKTTLDCPQMVFPATVALPEPDPAVIPLTQANASEMVALTDIAFPGFFRPRGPQMGCYFGIRSGTELIAMGGERFTFPGYSEISALCTHPAHRGNGHAASIIWEIVRRHRREGIVSWLHVAATNQRALNLYLQLGFQAVRTLTLYQVDRV